jgi:integrase/recombinase XerD
MPLLEPLRVSFGALLSPKPLEQLSLPSELDGGVGTNRVLGTRPQIAAQNDVDTIRAWLARFIETKATFDTYRKESERLLLWSTTELRKQLCSLTHEDLLIYRRFLADPQPAQRWVMTGRKGARAAPSWRPFAGPLSPTSERQAFVILNTLFAWLVNAGYLAGNPLSLSRQRGRKAKPRVTRFLEDDLWQAVKTSIDTMPRDTAREQEHYARVPWLISLLYLMGLRISEVVSNPMGGFFRRRDPEGQDRWWLTIVGKGDKERLLPATTELSGTRALSPTLRSRGATRWR